MEEELIAGFRKIFENPDRHSFVSLSYEEDVVPLLSEPRKLMYMSKSGTSISETVSKFKLPKNIEKMLIDISCSEHYTPKSSEMGSINEMINTYPDSLIEVVWGFCTDESQEEPIIIRIIIKTK